VRATGANILIVGAGPVGLAAALELARRGYKPRIVDKGEGFTPPDQSRALGVNNRTLQLLEPSGVSRELLAIGARLSHVRIRNEKRREVIRFDFAGAGALFPFMLIVPQGQTERILADALKALGVDIEWNAEIIASNKNASQPSVDINRQSGVDTLKTDMLIGADGANSIIRKEFGFSFDGEGYPAEFGLADLILDEDVDDTGIQVDFMRDGVLAWFPMGGRKVRFVSPRPDISKALPHDLKIREVVWRSSFHISFRNVGKMQNENVFLAGDAAHIHSPAGGRGMNLGIEDACWLAWQISEGRTNDYSAARLPEVRKVIAQTKQQTDGLIAMNAAARFARDHLADHLLKFPPFKRAALSRITGLDTTDPPWL